MLNTSQPQAYVYTDGGCTGNPGAGGWAAIIIVDGKKTELSGGEPATTNNRMELTAALKAMHFLRIQYPDVCQIHFTTDSQYLLKGLKEWMPNWLKRQWKTAAGKPVLNKDIWQDLWAEQANFQIQWTWVKGHTGHEYNERCDELVAIERERLKQSN